EHGGHARRAREHEPEHPELAVVDGRDGREHPAEQSGHHDPAGVGEHLVTESALEPGDRVETGTDQKHPDERPGQASDQAAPLPGRTNQVADDDASNCGRRTHVSTGTWVRAKYTSSRVGGRSASRVIPDAAPANSATRARAASPTRQPRSARWAITTSPAARSCATSASAPGPSTSATRSPTPSRSSPGGASATTAPRASMTTRSAGSASER